MVGRAEPESRPDQHLVLMAMALVVAFAAQLTDPGSLPEWSALIVPLLGFAAWSWLPRTPPELFAVAVVVPVGIVVGSDGNLEGALFLPVLMVLAVGARVANPVRAWAIALSSAAAVPIVAAAAGAVNQIGWEPWMAAHLFTFILGRLVRRQALLIEELNDTREALAAQAVAEERRRMARELHDLAGHTLAAMLLHVTGARHVLGRGDQVEAERALRDAEEAGQRGLGQLRSTVAALRTDEGGTDAPLADGDDVPALLERYRQTGLEVELKVEGSLHELDGPVGTGLHRIVDEALANVVNHAPANRAVVHISVLSPDSVTADICDFGRPPTGGDDQRDHFGIIGMSERARALGGWCTAGATDDGWRVDVSLGAP